MEQPKSQSGSLSSAQIHEATIQARKKAVLRNANSVAPGRDAWIKSNSFFYKGDWQYMRFLVPPDLKVLELGCGTGQLLAQLQPSVGVGIDLCGAMIDIAQKNYPELSFHVGDVEDAEVVNSLDGPFDVIVISDLLGQIEDCDQLFNVIKPLCAPRTRIVVAYYSPAWEPILRLANILGLRMSQPDQSWLSSTDIMAFLRAAEFDVIKREWRQLVPKKMFGLGWLINSYLAPLPIIRRFCLRNYVVARHAPAQQKDVLSTTVLVPCRNEKGNIEAAVTRLPKFCDDMEVIYIEGGSSDGTFEECERVRDASPELDIKVFKQHGKGKGDAVHLGFDKARGDIVMILDADLTVPPESLPKFYDVIASGRGEFVNGTRMVYPMQSGAMRFLNYWANRTFSLIFSWLLNQRFTDTLCGTKVIRKKDYDELARNRHYFGDFDPFGDYDLIFGASKLNLKIIEVPVRYADRTYGETQISRFRHGLLLLRMVIFAFKKLKAF